MSMCLAYPGQHITRTDAYENTHRELQRGGVVVLVEGTAPKLLTACFWVLQVVLAGGFLRAAGVASILYGTLLTTAGLGSQCPSHRSLHMLLKSP